MSKTPTVLEFWKDKIAGHVATASGLSHADALSLIEDRYDGGYEFAIAMQRIKKFKIQDDPAKVAAAWASTMQPDEYLAEAKVNTFGEGKKAMTYLLFSCVKPALISSILKRVFEQKESYGSTDDSKGKTILVEFSSPNIAKPFHAGHLRSTIIGNFLANLYKKMGANVTTINYLGDWGTQYGLLALGFKEFGSEDELAAAPIAHLFKVYVAANKKIDGDDKADPPVPPNPEFKDAARSYFKKMEDGDEEALSLWSRFRDLSIGEYKKIYNRLNVHFDIYSGESQQSKGMKLALTKLEECQLLKTDEKGARVIEFPKSAKLPPALIQKSDGATLYITRDIAAATERYEQYKFDKSIYVVASQQDLHFQQLFKILEMMGYPWAKNCVHVNFGMVKGMSTRKGTVVFLEQILDEAHSVMLEKMEQDTMGKLAEIKDKASTADTIGLSAVVVQDMGAKRGKDYEFDWNRITSFEGSTGPFLQYTHARLCSMEDRTSDIEVTPNIDASLLSEHQAIDLAICIAKFPQTLQICANTMEPSSLVSYLFDLCHVLSAAHSELRVKGSTKELAEARKLLFWAGRVILANGLTLIGLNPLTRI